MPMIRASEPQFVSGREFGFDGSVKVHVTAVLHGDIEVGANTRIDGGCVVTGRVRIGRNCHLSTGSCLFGAHGITVGDHVGISAGVRVFTGTDDPRGDLLGLHEENELEHDGVHEPVWISDYVTVGANAVVLPGTILGAEAMVGALTLCRGMMAGGYIYGGIPWRIIRPRPKLRYAA